MTDPEIAKDLCSRWSATHPPKCLSDWEAITRLVAGHVSDRMCNRFIFALPTCEATIHASDYDEAVRKLGSAGKPQISQ